MRTATMKSLREVSISGAIAVVLALIGLVIGVAALITSDPYLGLFGISVVCSGGVAAMVGLHD